MAILTVVSIDLTKIDKSKIINDEKGGKYLSLSVAVNDKFDDYGNNVAVSVSRTKGERDAGEKAVYLGNGRIVWRDDGIAVQRPPEKQGAQSRSSQPHDDLPF